MATFHCSAKIGKSGTGGAHADYIERDGKYASKEKDDLEFKESGNLPSWAETSRDFWHTADANERANGSVYREFEIALPRELTKDQRLELVREFVDQEIGDRHAYTFAIHNPKAAIDGGEQPHAHVMYSERKLDGIDRAADQYFKRWNAKKPEAGGCQKASGGKTKDELAASLLQSRKAWAELQNEHLARHGHAARVTHLSLKAQGIDREAEPHLGPIVAKALAKEVRAIRREAVKPVISQQRIDDGAARLLARAEQRAAERATVAAATRAQEKQAQEAQARAEMLAQVAREKEAARQEASRPKPEPDRGRGYSR